MSDLALDPVTRDIILPPRVITGAEQVAQALAIHLRTWFGEWFLDVTHGVPYLEQVLGRQARLAVVEGVIRSHILSVAGVQAIERFAMQHDPSARILTVEFTATTASGMANVSLRLAAR